jgi:probable HAF family extracellular repeat protein
MTNLGTLPGGTYSAAIGINNNGQIVGEADTASGQTHAFSRSGTVMTDLGALPGESTSSANAINNNGQIVGISAVTASGPFRAFLYSGGKMTNLGTLPGGTTSQAKGINDRGQIVGNANTASGQTHAFLYNPPTSPSSILLLLQEN